MSRGDSVAAPHPGAYRAPAAACAADVLRLLARAHQPRSVPELARLLGARPLKLHAGLVRALTTASWRLRLQPTPEGWLDMGLLTPLMDVSRIRGELGWEPRHAAGDALLELLEGMREGAGAPTPPLDPATSGPARLREFATGIGRRSGAG
jgi:hypothetical protein